MLAYRHSLQKGDPYIKIDEGYARLPGAGYEALHPELEGLNPEDYPDISKLRIMGDVAPYSREYQRYSSIVRHQTEDNPDLKVEYERIAEQVRQTKESTLHVAQRHFNAPIDTIEGTVKEATAGGIELEEYPGRTFQFSGDKTRCRSSAAHKTPRARGRSRPPRPGRNPRSTPAHGSAHRAGPGLEQSIYIDRIDRNPGSGQAEIPHSKGPCSVASRALGREAEASLFPLRKGPFSGSENK
jgi:hypothetical protein